ncbi:WXG100 family type VII secretion target [Streptomyces sp. 4N509B]|uniref:WXG100 family type VII secretion target n=1 Tax=Streptomyces sp. 4N509B TaxID=3457413 RepID=UPI003FD3BD92
MTAPTLSDFPALGFIPCPGDPDAMDAIVSAFSDTSNRLEEVCSVLTGADEGEWRGLTAIAFREVLDGDLRPKVDDAHQSFSDAHRALANWLDRMREDQATADSIEADAAAAKADMEAAQTLLDGMPPDTRNEDPPEDESDEDRQQREDDEQARGDAESDFRVAEAALQEFRDRATTLKENYEDYAGDVADQLRDAMDIAPNEPGFFGRMAEAVAGFVDSMMDFIADLGDAIIAVLGQLAPILSVINNILGLVMMVLSIASILAGGFLLTLFVLALITLVLTYTQKVGETGSFTEALKSPSVWISVVGVITGGTALAMARYAAPAMRTVESMSSWRTLGFSIRPADTYLSQGVRNAQYVHNTLTGTSWASEAYNSFFNPEGNHLGNLTGIGVNGTFGPFAIGDPNGGGLSGSDHVDNFTADDQEQAAGLLGTNPDTYGTR